MHLWTNAYAASHRINNRQLDDVYRMPVSFIPLTSLLPGASDMETFRSRMIAVVTRIIVSQLPACNHLKEHIQCSVEMVQKSKVVITVINDVR